MDVDGTNQRFLCEGYVITKPEFSPDGKKILFTTDDTLWTINIDGTNREILYEDSVGSIYTPIWSPKYSPLGNKIYFAIPYEKPNIGRTFGICSMNTDGSDLKKLTFTRGDYGLIINNTGTKILFISERDYLRDLFIMDMDGENQKKLTETSAHEENYKFSPDGRYICYRSMVGHSELYIMKSDGSNKFRIPLGESIAKSFCFLPKQKI